MKLGQCEQCISSKLDLHNVIKCNTSSSPTPLHLPITFPFPSSVDNLSYSVYLVWILHFLHQQNS